MPGKSKIMRIHAQRKEISAPRRGVDPAFDWQRIAYLLNLSRLMDELEETRLVPEKKVLYQFSARGHDMAQIILGTQITHRHDAVSGYYRSRPMMLTLGVPLVDALGSPMAKSGGYSDGRDIGVVFNIPGNGGPCALPMSGGVGVQYTPLAGWAQAIEYRRKVLGDESYKGAIGLVLGGDASVAANGFWSALTMATTLKLPVLFYIEDNGYGISVTSDKQTPGRNIAANLAAFQNLHILDGDGTNPAEAARLAFNAVSHVREGQGPALLRLTVPRLSGHSFQDTQTYKSPEVIAAETARDPYPKLHDYLVPGFMSADDWQSLKSEAQAEIEAALETALALPQPDPAHITRYVFSETRADGSIDLQKQGGLLPGGHIFPKSSETPEVEPVRINMVTAIRRTLDHELATNPKLVLFGEDIGPKGGVHAVTLGLQEKHGEGRVFDTSLSEEGIIGRAVGMAAAGLMPVAEIQFRKYADPAEEQLNDCGTMRWRTANRFAAPIVVRIPGGYFKCGDPWHSQSGEVKWAHAIGWQLVMPSNAEDAVGLLRSAMRSNNPTIFFEHRAMLDEAWARRPYPGDNYIIPFGKARRITEGDRLTVITWGAMVERCDSAAKMAGGNIDLLDLRSLSPWDKEAVVQSVKRTHRALIVHEDNLTAGFGAEIAAILAKEAFFELDAPVERLTMPDIPNPHNPLLLNAVVPSVEKIAAAMKNAMDI
jgi:2-oxoisovalerate dehydrogenase E1 component